MRRLIAYLFEKRFGPFRVRGKLYWRDYGCELKNGKGVSRVGRLFYREKKTEKPVQQKSQGDERQIPEGV